MAETKRGRPAKDIDYLGIPMQENDSCAWTIGGYLKALLLTLWDEQEGFSGKRPFGNSGWNYDLYAALIKANVVSGQLDQDGYVESVDYEQADKIVRDIIVNMF